MIYITYYLLSHKDNNIISTNNPVTPPFKNEPTKVEILVTTSIPNQPEPKITVDRIETDTNDANTPENESEEDNVSTMMAGVIYNCTDGLTFSPHIVQTTEGTGDPMMDFKVLFQLKF